MLLRLRHNYPNNFYPNRGKPWHLLRYSPETVQPPNDDYKKELIKHANLGKPLANGWTLFDHQKKAILKALLMRRFILALDMGLGMPMYSGL
jgi:hypothetical protein